MCAFLLCLALPSHAGQWVITLSGNTSSSASVGNYTFANSQVTGPSPWSSANSPYFTVSGGFPVASCSLGLPGTVYVTAKLTWQPSAPGDTSAPPPTVDVLETASASDAAWMLQPTGVVASASDGFNDPVVYATPPVYGATSSGKHLYHLTVVPGQNSVTLPLRTLGASLSYATALVTSSPSVGIIYSVQQDTREVMISSNFPNLTYSKGGAASVSVTETATITGQQTLGAPSVAAFQANEGITNGKTYAHTYTTQSTFVGAPQALTQFYAAMSYEDRSGTCDMYAANGFQGATTWFGRWSSGATSVGEIEYPPQ